MANQTSVTVTCDGCGSCRTFVFEKDKREDFSPWYDLNIDVAFRTLGQPSRAEPIEIEACSPDCVQKALAKRLPGLPEKIPPLRGA